MLKLICECGKPLKGDDNLVGKRVKCPRCGRTFTVEETAEERTAVSWQPTASPTPPALPNVEPSQTIAPDQEAEEQRPHNLAKGMTRRRTRRMAIGLAVLTGAIVAAVFLFFGRPPNGSNPNVASPVDTARSRLGASRPPDGSNRNVAPPAFHAGDFDVTRRWIKQEMAKLDQLAATTGNQFKYENARSEAQRVMRELVGQDITWNVDVGVINTKNVHYHWPFPEEHPYLAIGRPIRFSSLDIADGGTLTIGTHIPVEVASRLNRGDRLALSAKITDATVGRRSLINGRACVDLALAKLRATEIEFAPKGTYRHGKKDGDWTEFYASGQKLAQGVFRDGIRQGKWTYWHPNGQQSMQGDYQDGVAHGAWVRWEPDGKRDPHIVDLSSKYPTKFVAFSLDGRFLAGLSAAVDKWEVLVWSWPDSQKLYTFTGPDVVPEFMFFRGKDRPILIFGGRHVHEGRRVVTVDVEAGNETTLVPQLEFSASSAMPVDCSPDGKILVVGFDLPIYGDSGRIAVYEWRNGWEKSRTLSDNMHLLQSLHFAPNGRTLFAFGKPGLLGENSTVFAWDTESWQVKTRFNEKTDFLTAIAFGPDDNSIAVGCNSGRVAIIDRRSGREQIRFRERGSRTLVGAREASVHSIALNGIGTLLAAGIEDGKRQPSGRTGTMVAVWDVRTRKELRVFADGVNASSVCFSPDGRYLAVSTGASIRVYDARVIGP